MGLSHLERANLDAVRVIFTKSGNAPVFDRPGEQPLDAMRLLRPRLTLPQVPMGHGVRAIRC